MGVFSKIVEWFKGPAEDEEVIEIAARKAAEKAAAMAAREQAAARKAESEQSPAGQVAPADKAPDAGKAPSEPKPASKKTASKPVAKKVVPAVPERNMTASEKFPGVTTYRELSILEKNSCAGADRASKTVAVLTKELKETVLQIARLRNPVDADQATRDKLSKERAELRKQRDEKERALTLARNSGIGLERTADNCQFLIRELTGQEVNHRKEARFNEVAVNITPEEVQQMRRLLK